MDTNNKNSKDNTLNNKKTDKKMRKSAQPSSAAKLLKSVRNLSSGGDKREKTQKTNSGKRRKTDSEGKTSTSRRKTQNARKRAEGKKSSASRRKNRKRVRNLQIFVIGIVAILAVLAIIFVPKIYSAGRTRALAKQKQQQEEDAAFAKKVKSKTEQAEILAARYDYDKAIETLESVADKDESTQKKIQEYTKAKESLVEASIDNILALNVSSLIADTSITWSMDNLNQMGDYNQGHLTIGEFQTILQQLYDKGYVLVSMNDLISVSEKENKVSKGQILLPEGKTPFILVYETDFTLETMNCGFASRLTVDSDGNISSEMLDANGETQTGAYDLVPILDAFIDEHPDFSYRGAKAVLSVSGEDGILGYRTDPDLAKSVEEGNARAETYGTFDTASETSSAQTVAQTLVGDGYEFACATSGSVSYSSDLASVKKDYKTWKDEVGSIVGDVDILAFPNGSDLQDGFEKYSGDTYKYLKKQGFYFYSCIDSSRSWTQFTGSYVRVNRVDLTGYALYLASQGESSLLANLIDAASVYDSSRPETGITSHQIYNIYDLEAEKTKKEEAASSEEDSDSEDSDDSDSDEDSSDSEDSDSEDSDSEDSDEDYSSDSDDSDSDEDSSDSDGDSSDEDSSSDSEDE